MTAPQKLQLVILALLALPACTDRRPKFLAGQFGLTPPSPISLISTAQFENKATEAMQMEIVGDSLFMTGRPFGVARLDIGADPTNPTLTFAASNQIEAFSPYPQFGFWTPDNFAQGALDVWGKMALMSGAAGVSMVDISQTHTPVEIGRYPSAKVNDVQVTRDPAYVYAALVHHPTLPVAYGFSDQDFIYTLSLNQSGLSVVQKDAYGPQNVCCAMGAAVAGSHVVLAMKASLWTFDLDNGGQLQNPNRIDAIQAVNVVSTGRFIYIQHRPSGANAAGPVNPAGIYVFDMNGTQVSYFPITPVRFAVYNDQYIYANMDNVQVSVYGIR
ncbi:MAG: hypothetical protein HYZ71_14925 [Deltaproteobacteria bacterium]|nr:hypothetical protein [Deltaproteobacteria bacterium]